MCACVLFLHPADTHTHTDKSLSIGVEMCQCVIPFVQLCVNKEVRLSSLVVAGVGHYSHCSFILRVKCSLTQLLGCQIVKVSFSPSPGFIWHRCVAAFPEDLRSDCPVELLPWCIKEAKRQACLTSVILEDGC